MDQYFYPITAFYLVISIILSFLINYLFLRFSRGLGVRNNTEFNQERWSAEVKPSVGGFSFFILFLISFAFINIIPNETNITLSRQLMGLLMASVVGFVLGLADDTYNTNPLVKFIGQLACAFILIVTDVVIPVTNIETVNFVLTTIWVIGLMNSINMLDNMDGITASTSASIILGALIFSVFQKQEFGLTTIILIGVLGGLIGFLYYNWNPAKMYMGDTGSQFLGVFLAGISILFFWQERSGTPQFFEIKLFIIPALMFIVPLIDTTTVTIRRLARRQSPFVGGRDHITHHLVYFGFTEKQAAVFLLAISLSGVVISTLLITKVINWTFLTTILCIAYFVAWFIIIQVLYNIGKNKQALKEKSTT